MGSLGVVALFNSNIDAIKMIGKLVESAGFSVVSVLIPDVRDGRCDVNALMVRHDPSVVIYDIGPPYDDNWAMLQELRSRPSMHDRRFVITAVNASRVEALAGRDERIYEVVDKASDLGALVQAVKEAARTRAVIAQPQRSNVTIMTDRRHYDRRQPSWTSNEVYAKLREKREEVELERRRGGRRATDREDGPHHSHAA